MCIRDSFSILRAQIDATSQMGDPNEVVGLLNLQAKLDVYKRQSWSRAPTG